ncbi:serine-protein kinase ATM isoform X2 [Tribolium madens]|nr:serine-protein kinase ATM isoform X2 [Tribolium madens]
MAKDHNKILEDSRKKGTNPVAPQSVDLFEHFVRVAIKYSCGLNFRKIFCFIIEELHDGNKKYFHYIFLKIISQSFLSNPKIRSLLQGQDWEGLYLILKTLKTEDLKCLALVIKWGPLHKLSVSLLRGEFGFVKDLCHEMSSLAPKPRQETLLELVYDFCQNTAKDNRMACCKLGEDIFKQIITFYERNSNDSKIKLKIIDFFLLQMALHHPGGAKFGDPAAYAVSSDVWQHCLSNIYDILTNEIDNNLGRMNRNQSFFIVNNDILQLSQTFTCLFVGVCRQLFVGDIDFEEPVTKRGRIEFSFANLIRKINNTKSWLWMSLTSSFIESYPNMVNENDYVTLLKLLTSLQHEKEPTLVHYIYKQLNVLKKIERHIKVVGSDDLWKATLRQIGMNQANDEVQVLLQQLLAEKYITSHEILFQYFQPFITLNVTKCNLRTLEKAFTSFVNLQHDTSFKSNAISWILNRGAKLFDDIYIAEILVRLIMKQWTSDTYRQLEEKKRIFDDIEDIYLTISFEHLLTWERDIKKEVDITVCVEQILFDTLITQLTNLNCGDTTEELLNVTLLTYHVLSFLHKFDIIDSESTLWNFFANCTKNLFEKVSLDLITLSERGLQKLNDVVKKLNVLFCTNVSDFCVKQLRAFVSEDLIKAMFVGLHTESDDVSHEDPFLTFRKSLIETLVSFSCLPSCGDLLPIQQRALSALIDYEYDCSYDSDYHLVLALLHSIQSCQPKSLDEKTLLSIFNIFQKFCEIHYHCYFSAVEILGLFYKIYPFVASSDSDFCKSQYVEVLFPFFLKRADYGPDVSNELLQCMGLLFELEPNCQFSRWSNEEIVLKIPEFLQNDFQEVRFNAIRNLARFFKLASETGRLEQFHRQEIMFSVVSDMSLKLFEIEGNVTQERVIDETVTRSTTVLHLYASIMLASHLWIEEALFALLKIFCDKKLDLSQVGRVIEMVAHKLGFNSGLNFLERYLVGLVNSWKNFDMNRFPYGLYNCDSKIEFYTKYWTFLAPLIIEEDINDLNQVALNLGKTPQKLIEDTCPRLLSYCLSQEVSNLTRITANNIYIHLSNTVGVSKCREIFKSNIEEVILNLAEFICDEKQFQTFFSRNIIFPKNNSTRLTVDDFYNCLHFIENTLYDENSVIADLMSHSPAKIHFILLQINLRISAELTLEEKLRYFQIYSILVTLCVEAVMGEPSMQLYLIRDLTHTLLHHIKNYKIYSQLSEISCKFFKMVLKKILPDLATMIKDLFPVIVSRLRNIALEDCQISSLCVGMLEFLIVDHKDLFYDEIQKLDSIPEISKFAKIFSVHYEIKYGNRKVTLNDEILQFLTFAENIESVDECQHSLTHLRKLLTDRKDQLKQLYVDLHQTRGFSEDCENSILHKLICMLITFSCSTNRDVRNEAVRCLGEIGPADLGTLILKPEKAIPDSKLTPWELLLRFSLSLLSKFIIDSDATVIKVASIALFQILSTKEGRKVQTDTNCHYLTPFYSMKVSQSSFNDCIDVDTFLKVINDDDLWIPVQCTHSTWITRLVTGFLRTFQERSLCNTFIDVCKVKTEFSEQFLPLLVYHILYSNINTCTNLITSKISLFFNKHWNITVKHENCDSITVNKASVQTMLDVVHFVRLQQNVRKKQIILNLDYLKMAKAAHFCTAHFTALLYADLWCQAQIDQSPIDYALSSSTYTSLDLIYEKVDRTTGQALQHILREAYKAVGERDALLGCGSSHLLDATTRVEHYKELGRWDQVTHYYEMEVSTTGGAGIRPLVDSLIRGKMYQLSLFCSDAYGEPNYESLWRLGKWECNKRENSEEVYYDKCKFYAIKALREEDDFGFLAALEGGWECVVGEFMGANMESIKHFYDAFGRLQALKELEDFAKALSENKLAELLVKWKLQDEIISNEYGYIEPIQAQRIVLLRDLLTKNLTLNEVMMDMIIRYAQFARIEGNSFEASRILKQLKSLKLSNDVEARIQFEEAQLCWSIKDNVTAKCILKQFCTNENIDPRLHAMALKMTGEWMAESSSENYQTIIQNYFQKSLNLLKTTMEKSVEDQKSILDTFHQLAKFADQGYQDVMSHIKSDIFQKKKENMNKAKETVSKINLKKATKDERKAVVIKEKHCCIDENEIRSIEAEKNVLLQLALRYYLLNLIGSDEHNITIFRLISLLLENRSNDLIRTFLEKDVLNIPTYKYISILPQIVPHIAGATCDIFGQTVNNIIEKCAKDHPYHTLPSILALTLSNKDRDYAESKTAVNDGRDKNSRTILDRLKKTDRNLSNLIERMEFVSEAVIELAYHKNDSDDGSYKVPKRCKICKIQNYDNVLVPTYNLAVSKSCTYQIVGISRFGNSYQNVGGINAPKKIICRGTDGKNRTQLIKGRDDLRQDAVMQQVFTIMNSLLNVNKQTRNLLIRTYKIVPLSKRSGILEWVDNTMPFGVYLTGEDGDGGAHVKYRPMDRRPRKCRADFKNAANSSNEERLRNFNKICQNIKPVFHKFFESAFPQPTVWYERRRAYINSVATSSMCGYILGIGDRHVSNILIDKSTAEVVHIDFGIAFEQGRVLPTPETVPFRLSRDMVDGMGVSGVEGVFRRACEKTVEVLRQNYQTIITILEVLLYDPLYDWTVSTAEANKRQKVDLDDTFFNMSFEPDEINKDVNVTAERALLRLKDKLQGLEKGKLMTVEHQVETLIQQAMDPANLSKLFHGWQPYL